MSDELAKKILIEAARCVDDRNWDAAVNAFERLARVRPLDPKVIYNKGVAYTRLMRFSEAKADFVRAIELENNYPLARNSYKEICNELTEIPNPLLMPTESAEKENIDNQLSVFNPITEDVPVVNIIPEPEPVILTSEEKDEIDWDKFEETGTVTIGASANIEPYVENTPAVDIPQSNINPEPDFNIFDDGIETSNAITSYEGESSFIFDEAEEPIIEKIEPINDFVITAANGITFDLNDTTTETNDKVGFKSPLETNNLDFLPAEEDLVSTKPFNPTIPDYDIIDIRTPLETANIDYIPMDAEVNKINIEPEKPISFQFEEAPEPLTINDNDDADGNEGKGRKIIFDLDA